MLRFFHSPYPTFGRQKQPSQKKIEASPYFWWWYALTLNNDYAELCEQKATNTVLNTTDARMMKLNEDFGDVRYEGDRYVAFKQWWTERVNTNEQRGVYLFAEPPHTASVSVIQHVDEAAAALSSEDTVLIAVNVTRQRRHIDGRIDRILRKHMGELKRGRQVRNPKLSAARYRLSKAVQAQTLKKTFAVYDIRTAAAAEGRRVSNWEVAKLAKLGYRQREKGLDVYDETAVKRVVSAIVARHVKHANTMIESAAFGVFP